VNQEEAAKEEAKKQLGQELLRAARGGSPFPRSACFLCCFFISTVWMVFQCDFSDKSRFQTMREGKLEILSSNSQSSFRF